LAGGVAKRWKKGDAFIYSPPRGEEGGKGFTSAHLIDYIAVGEGGKEEPKEGEFRKGPFSRIPISRKRGKKKKKKRGGRNLVLRRGD